MSLLHELRIEVNDVDESGIKFMCHDNNGENPCHVVLTAEMARELAAELLEAADDLEELCKTPASSTS